MLPHKLILAAMALWFALVVSCGDDDDAGSDSTPTPPPLPTAHAPADFDEILAEPGLDDFARAVAEAIDGNDTQFLIDNAAFTDFECAPPAGIPAPPENCAGQPDGTIVPAIQVKRWQSEGGIYGPEQYETAIQNAFDDEAPADSRMYAVGEFDYATEDWQDDTLDLAAFADGFDNYAPGILPTISFGLANVDGEWRITEIGYATEAGVAEAFQWYVPWDAAFP